MPVVPKTAISRKTKSFGTFCFSIAWIIFFLSILYYSFSIAWIFGIINQIIQKTQSLQILICSLLQAKHLVITQEKDDGVKMVLSYCLQQNVGVELHMI